MRLCGLTGRTASLGQGWPSRRGGARRRAAAAAFAIGGASSASGSGDDADWRAKRSEARKVVRANMGRNRGAGPE